MPELPGAEVERVRTDIAQAAAGRLIRRVDTTVDEIVFDGVKSVEFEKALIGRRVISCERRGKNFFLRLDGADKLPVMHLGMTGRIYVKDQAGLKYQEGGDTAGEWPPKWMKFVLHLDDEEGKDAQIAFSDPRRLGRIRLRADPLNEPPLSLLGPDPIINPPSPEDWAAKIQSRRSPIKSVLLDQAVAAGIGNWVADEILFHAGMHPMTVASSLDAAQLETLREKMIYVCRTAVDVGADSAKFPPGWLMRHRWGKGKKKGLGEEFKLADGTPAVVEFITVGGRTSAFVAAVQPPPAAQSSKASKTTKPSKQRQSSAGPSRRSMSSSLSPPPRPSPPPFSTSSRPQRATRKRVAVASKAEDAAEEVLDVKQKRIRRG